jgi:Ca2+-binding EF-hand superfamily protein
LDNDGKISFDEFAKIMSLELDKMAKTKMHESIQMTTEGGDD